MAIHPELGTRTISTRSSRRRGAGHRGRARHRLPGSPDHPWVAEHPEWFAPAPTARSSTRRTRPRNTRTSTRSISRAQDWRGLWEALEEVSLLDRARACTIFRVDNPHTKAFPFWEWVIADVKRDHPDVLFLAEAFTRPKVMYRLAKLGFSQSYTYFTWRNTAADLSEYLEELYLDRRSTSFSGPISGRTRPTSCMRPADGRPGSLRGAIRAGSDARVELRHLRPGLRARRIRRASRAPRST